MNYKIITIVTIVAALIFSIVMINISNTSMNAGKLYDKNLNNSIESIKKAKFEAFDNKLVSGDTIVNIINNSDKELQKYSFAVKINGTVYKYGYKGVGIDTSNKATISSLSSSYEKYKLKSKDVGFISPASEFKSDLVINKNGIVMGVMFIIQ